ncbi:MAG: hypothetical protein K8I03_13245, partial [Ignavibacteria bacterium]|nr:hypothetical protein [Ignavibacteria bacterium]
NNLVVERNNHLNSHQFIPWMFLFLDENKLPDLEEYISTYGKYLTDEDKDSSIKFGKVMVLFMNSEFHKALSVLSKINFKLSTLKIILRKITLMIYYELNDYEGFIMSFDSYKHFLGYGNWAKKEWIDFYIKKAKNFAGIIDKLFKLRESGNKIEIELCKKELEESGIDNKKWFLRKVEELKKPA